MAELHSHYRGSLFPRARKASMEGIPAAADYGDVFGGPPKFSGASPMLDEYGEIFGGFAARKGGGVGIPFLELPELEEDEGLSASGVDYGEVFGCRGSGRFAIDFRSVFTEQKLDDRPVVGTGNPHIPADLLDDCNGSSSASDRDTFSPNEQSPYIQDGTQQFNVLYNKSSYGIQGDMANGATHVTELNEIPGFAFVVDSSFDSKMASSETTFNGEHIDFNSKMAEKDVRSETSSQVPLHNNALKDSKINFHGKEDVQLATEFSEKTKEHVEQACNLASEENSNFMEFKFGIHGSDHSLPINTPLSSDGDKSLLQKVFITVSDINLRTQPSRIPPPTRAPPKLQTMQVKESIEKLSYGTPPLVEVDAKSDAAASAAVMREAMEKAQAKLKSARESMEKRRLNSRYHYQSGSNQDQRRTSKQLNEDKLLKVNDAHQVYEHRLRISEIDGSVIARATNRASAVSDSAEKVELNDLSEKILKPLVERCGKESEENSLSCNLSDQTVELKVDEQFYELVSNETKQNLVYFAEQGIEDQKFMGKLRNPDNKGCCKSDIPVNFEGLMAYRKEESELNLHPELMQLTRNPKAVLQHQKSTIKNVQMLVSKDEKEREQAMFFSGREKRVVEFEENISENKYQTDSDADKHIKRQAGEGNKERAALNHDEEKMLKEVQERAVEKEKKQNAAFELEEEEKRLEAAHNSYEREKRMKLARDHGEEEKRLRTTHEREEEKKRLRDAYELEEEKRQRAARVEEDKRLRAAQEEKEKRLRAREEEEKRLKAAQEEKEKILMAAREEQKRLKAAQEEKEKKLRAARKEEEKRLKAAHEEKEKRLMVAREEEQERLKAAQEEKEKTLRAAREEEQKKLKAAEEEKEKRLRAAREEEQIRLKAARERKEEEMRLKAARESEEEEKRLKAAHEREEEERKLRAVRQREEEERRLRVACEREEEGRRQRVVCEQQEEEKRLKENLDCEEGKQTASAVHESEQKRLNARDHEEDEKRQKTEEKQTKSACETEEEGNSSKAVCSNGKQEETVRAEHEEEMSRKLATEYKDQDEQLISAIQGEEEKMHLQEAFVHEEKENRPESICEREEEQPRLPKTRVHEEDERKLQKDYEHAAEEKGFQVSDEHNQVPGTPKVVCEHEQGEKNLKVAFEQEEEEKQLNASCKLVDGKRELKPADEYEDEKRPKEACELEENVMRREAACEHEEQNRPKVVYEFRRDKSKKVDEECAEENGRVEHRGHSLPPLLKKNGNSVKNEVEANGTFKNNETETKEVEVTHESAKFEMKGIMMSGQKVISNGSVTASDVFSMAVNEGKSVAPGINREVDDQRYKENQKQRERNLEGERLRTFEEERERQKEREKDRIAVENVIRESRDRAYAQVKDRAEKAAAEKTAAESRQRALAEARERAERIASAEKAATDSARLRAERAAVERVTFEARQRALDKVMAAVKDKPDYASGQNTSSSDDRSFHASTSETAQRCKARLERHQRTAQRAAKALAEKNMRDILTQREQSERNRLADTLDADIRRWSNGKEGNLRALLSTLQYILGPESGWQPVSLTEVITAVAVKKVYRKATLCVHPDKVQQRGASVQQKYICEKVFDLIKDAWNKFNSEER